MPLGWEVAPPEVETQWQTEADDLDQALADCLDTDVSELQDDGPTAVSAFVNSLEENDERVVSKVTAFDTESEAGAVTDRSRGDDAQQCYLAGIEQRVAKGARDGVTMTFTGQTLSGDDIEIGESTVAELYWEYQADGYWKTITDDSIAFRVTGPARGGRSRCEGVRRHCVRPQGTLPGADVVPDLLPRVRWGRRVVIVGGTTKRRAAREDGRRPPPGADLARPCGHGRSACGGGCSAHGTRGAAGRPSGRRGGGPGRVHRDLRLLAAAGGQGSAQRAAGGVVCCEQGGRRRPVRGDGRGPPCGGRRGRLHEPHPRRCPLRPHRQPATAR